MSKKVIDGVLSSGNLTMGQVNSMFQRIVLAENDFLSGVSDSGGVIGRWYGRVLLILQMSMLEIQV